MTSTRGAPPPSPVRELLRRYLAAWADGAAHGLSRLGAEGGDLPEALLIDGFAGADYPAEPPHLPCALEAAVRLLAEPGSGSVVRILLLEEDPAKADWLEGALARVLPGEPVHRRSAPALQPALNLREVAWAELGELPGPPARETMLLLDPPAAGQLPLTSLLPWLRQGSADLLLRFPAADLRRLARYQGSTLADLPPYPKRLVEGISRLLGDPRHSWALAWRKAAPEDPEETVRRLAGQYAERLGVESGRVVRRLPLTVGGAEGEEHLLLVTGDPARALLLNRLVYELRCAGRLPWAEGEGGLVRYPVSGELPLFGGPGSAPAASGPRERVVDRTALAHSIAERFAGRSVTLGQVLASLLDTELFVEDVRRALTELRRDGRALFRALSRSDADIAFPRTGTRLRVRSAQKRRPNEDEELSLSLEASSD